MEDQSQTDAVGRMEFTLRIITASITAGLLLFAVIIWFIAKRPEPPPVAVAAAVQAGQAQAVAVAAPAPAPRTPVMTYVALFVAFSSIGTAFTIPKVVEAKARRGFAESLGDLPVSASKLSPEKLGPLLAARQTTTIVKAALIEGPGFFLLIAYLLEGELLALYAAIGVIAVLASLIPLPGATLAWLESQVELMHTERMAA